MLNRLVKGDLKPPIENENKIANRYHRNMALANHQNYDRYLGPHGKGGKANKNPSDPDHRQDNEHHSLLVKATLHSDTDQDLENLYDLKDNLKFANSFLKNYKRTNTLSGRSNIDLDERKILFDVVYKSIEKKENGSEEKDISPRAHNRQQKKRQGQTEGGFDFLKDQKEFLRFAQLLK